MPGGFPSWLLFLLPTVTCLLDNDTEQQSDLWKSKLDYGSSLPESFDSFLFHLRQNLNSFPWLTMFMILILLILEKSSPKSPPHFYFIQFLDHVGILPALEPLGCCFPDVIPCPQVLFEPISSHLSHLKLIFIASHRPLLIIPMKYNSSWYSLLCFPVYCVHSIFLIINTCIFVYQLVKRLERQGSWFLH